MKKIILIIVATLFVTIISAQDRNAVVAAYNEGAKAAQTDAVTAITAFEKAITLADQVGAETADLKEKASKVLPGLYIKVASAAATEKKPAPEIMKAAKNAVAIAEKYGTQTHKDNTTKLLVQAYNIQATGYFSQNEFDKALVTFDSLLAINPGFVSAYYNKALIYLKQDNAASFEQSIDLYIEKLKVANDTTKIKQASSQALGYFRAAGSKANQAEKLDDALSLLNKASKYGDDKDLFYFLADVYNKKKNFDSGLEYAKKGLDLETGVAEAKAKFFFQLGLAQSGKGQTADACASFKNSMFGAFLEASKAERKNLKCE
ncbi:MAG: tetratricopeptide repeat protein [Bacteroidales bacterium]|jgi:tetratricopeptide (TPR) repeat protein|nr:tetratricopeptide repeat protein [Bacteroidales bacterium]